MQIPFGSSVSRTSVYSYDSCLILDWWLRSMIWMNEMDAWLDLMDDKMGWMDDLDEMLEMDDEIRWGGWMITWIHN